MTIFGRVAACCMMLQLPLNVSQQTTGAEAEKFCPHPRRTYFLLHHGQPVERLLRRADSAGRFKSNCHSSLLSIFANGAHHDQAHGQRGVGWLLAVEVLMKSAPAIMAT